MEASVFHFGSMEFCRKNLVGCEQYFRNKNSQGRDCSTDRDLRTGIPFSGYMMIADHIVYDWQCPDPTLCPTCTATGSTAVWLCWWIVSEWMSEKISLDLSPGEAAGRLDLISKVPGLEQAEKYLSNIPVTLVGVPVYGALLNCFAHARNLEKTEAIMQKMRELGFAKRGLPYNVMLKLYSDMGNLEKLDSLTQEMEEKGITWDKFTYNTRLNAYANASDLGGMEKLLMKMEADPEVTIDWKAYVVVANGYLRAGAVEKASSMLKESEHQSIL
ncbi:hypothetical protein Vadar_033879 [Vaccinium darrowii]|uniref:Uncharacterized protein n=1 Tax=Vaccinium darrowii TaxID=229202 RepID=A0ACB7XW69_9ERIC|nr:hypothetical protein Vadar_033879 [Vaccinium darrowii]